MRIVNGEEYYTPREIAETGLITNSKGNPDYNFVHRLINRGELEHVVLNEKSKIPYKYVPKHSIDAYNGRFEVKSPTTK